MDILRIECVGGESMSEEKKLVFLNPEDVPILSRGRSGKNWSVYFDQIPVGKVLEMTEDEYGSPATIRDNVNKYNKTKKDKVLKASGRTDKKTSKITIYVQRLKK